MVKEVIWDKKFEATFKKIKGKATKGHIRKQVKKNSYIGDTLIFLSFIPHKKL